MRGNLGLFVSAADRARLAAIVADRNSPQKHVWRARVVLLTRGSARHRRDHAPDGLEQAVGLALAGAVPRGGRRRAAARSDPAVAGAAARPSKVAERDPAHPGGAAAGRGDALDGAGDGAGERRVAGHGASDLAGARPGAASAAALQAVDRSGVRGQGRGRGRPLCRLRSSMRSCCRSTRSRMCGWPPARKRKVSVWHNAVALRSCVRPVDAVVA